VDTETIARVALLVFLMIEGTLLFTPYEAAFESIAAIGLIVAVFVGFALHPRKDVFYVRTVVRARSRKGHIVKEKDFVAVRVELVRLWILFIPTMMAVGLLVFTAARGKLWEYSLLQRALPAPYSYFVLQLTYYAPFAVILLLCVWIGERWVMRDAEACYARDFTINAGLVGFQFMGEHGDYYGGYGIYFGLVRSVELRSIVFYNPRKWERNRIALGMLFHGPVVLGRGVTDLHADTVKQHGALAEPATAS
jgi:hypothetical protein